MICGSYEYLAGGLASAVAEIVTLPMDTVKVRIQTTKPASQFALVKTMIVSEGLSSFFQGAEPAIIRQLLYGSMRYGLYPPIKLAIGDFLSMTTLTISPFNQKLFAGMLSGALSSALCNPTGDNFNLMC